VPNQEVHDANAAAKLSSESIPFLSLPEHPGAEPQNLAMIVAHPMPRRHCTEEYRLWLHLTVRCIAENAVKISFHFLPIHREPCHPPV
jgi:hypothetical protein